MAVSSQMSREEQAALLSHPDALVRSYADSFLHYSGQRVIRYHNGQPFPKLNAEWADLFGSRLERLLADLDSAAIAKAKGGR